METERKGGTRALNAVLGRLIAPALRRQGFAAADVVTRWPVIVGPLLSRHSVPEKLKHGPDGGTLYITVDGPVALELQHLEPLVLDRINTYFGYRAVARLAIKQGALPPVEERSSQMKSVSDDEVSAVRATLGEISHKPLSDALSRLGARIATRNRENRGRRDQSREKDD